MISASHLHLKLHVDSVMCKGCTDSIENVLKANTSGIDSISSDPAQKTIDVHYNLQHLMENLHLNSASVHPSSQSMRLNFNYGDLLHRITHALGTAEHDAPQVRLAEITVDGKALPHGEALPEKTASSETRPQTGAITQPRKKAGPLFSEVLMQHPAMKTLQATTMVLMIPMIPIMLSAIYVVISRSLKKPTPMPGM